MKRAKVIDAKEDVRPVTAARKVEVWIKQNRNDDDDFLGEFNAAPAGYLVARQKKGRVEDEEDGNYSSNNADDCLRCVCVCGLLHVPGIVRHLNDVSSRSSSSMFIRTTIDIE